MSVQALGWVIQNSPTKSDERCVLIAIANHTNAESEAWPSMTTIAREANVKPDSAKRIIRRLHAEGHITRVVHGALTRRTTPGRQPNLYVLTMDTGEIDRLRKERIGGAEAPCNSEGSGPGIGGAEDTSNFGGAEATPYSDNWGEPQAVIGGADAPWEPREEPSLSDLRDQRSPEEAVCEAFECFWRSYPKRHGKRVGKKEALAQWKRLSRARREVAAKAVIAYGDHCRQTNTFPKDALRWLRDGAYEEWDAEMDGAGSRWVVDS